MTGDTLVSSLSAANSAKSSHQSDSDKDEAVLAGMVVPAPVFFCSVEPASLSQQTALEQALICLTREDPSLQVHVDPDTGQTVLSGMGELHLEVIHERLRSEYKVDADLGPLQIAYRETVGRHHHEHFTLDRTVGEQRHLVTLEVSVEPGVLNSGTQKTVVIAPEKKTDFDSWLRKRHSVAINSGLQSALSRGMNGDVIAIILTAAKAVSPLRTNFIQTHFYASIK